MVNTDLPMAAGKDINDHEDGFSTEAPPGSPAYPNNQGLLRTCTVHGIAKGIVDGFMDGRFVRGKSVDIDQEEVTQILLNVHKDGTGKWPWEFHNQNLLIKDNMARYWSIMLQVQELPTVYDFPTENQRLGVMSQ